MTLVLHPRHASAIRRHGEADYPAEACGLIGGAVEGDQKITVQHWNNLQSLDWTADGKGLFTSSMQPSGVLLHVDLQGHANILWEPKGTQMPWAIPSPDGRHVAMPGYAQNSNAWMMQNF